MQHTRQSKTFSSFEFSRLVFVFWTYFANCQLLKLLKLPTTSTPKGGFRPTDWLECTPRSSTSHWSGRRWMWAGEAAAVGDMARHQGDYAMRHDTLQVSQLLLLCHASFCAFDITSLHRPFAKKTQVLQLPKIHSQVRNLLWRLLLSVWPRKSRGLGRKNERPKGL